MYLIRFPKKLSVKISLSSSYSLEGKKGKIYLYFAHIQHFVFTKHLVPIQTSFLDTPLTWVIILRCFQVLPKWSLWHNERNFIAIERLLLAPTLYNCNLFQTETIYSTGRKVNFTSVDKMEI